MFGHVGSGQLGAIDITLGDNYTPHEHVYIGGKFEDISQHNISSICE